MPSLNSKSSYYILAASNPDRMLLYDLPRTPDDESWTLGQRFKSQPALPVVAEIQTGNEKSVLLPFFGTPQIMSNEFLSAMREAGVDNLDVYDAVIRSEDGKIEHKGYKAFNVIGLIKAADMKGTRFAPDNPSRLIDASIDHLEIDEAKTQGALCFRMAEYTGSVIIHEKVKRVLEAKKFNSVVFRELKDFVS